MIDSLVCALGNNFLRDFQDMDDTVHTELHGKISKKTALFHVVREIRVPQNKATGS